MKKTITSITLLFIFSAITVFAVSDDYRQSLMQEIQDESNSGLQQAGVSARAMYFHFSYDRSTDYIIVHVTGVLSEGVSPENLMRNMIEGMGSDGRQAMRELGYKGFKLYANGSLATKQM